MFLTGSASSMGQHLGKKEPNTDGKVRGLIAALYYFSFICVRAVAVICWTLDSVAQKLLGSFTHANVLLPLSFEQE